MVQGYTQQDCGSKGGWSSGLLSKRSEGRSSFTGTIQDRGEELLCSYPCGVANDQRVSYLPEEPKLSGVVATDREVGGPMLNVTGLNSFYYLRDFTDMRCKHSRVLSIIREQLHREPDDGDVFIVMARDRCIVRLFMYIFAFLKDGSLPINNNLAERAIRPLTTQRNAILRFGSDEGVEMAATYYSIISTVKMQGRSAWEYLGKIFTKSLIKRTESCLFEFLSVMTLSKSLIKQTELSLFEFLSVKTLSKIFNGCRDFFSMRPDRIFVPMSAEPSVFELC